MENKNQPSKFQRAYGLEINALNSMFNKAPPADKKSEEDTFDIPEPAAIKEYLDRFVVGQEEAKKAVSTLMVNHLVRFRYNKDIEKDTQKLAKSNVLFVGDSGCVDSETEFLSAAGTWVKISSYTNQEVGQINFDTGELSFTKPLRYIKEKCDKFTLFKGKYGIDQALSDDHRVLYTSKKGVKREILAGDMPEKFYGRIDTTFKVEGGEGLNLSPSELRVQVALMADGHFPPGNTNRVVIRIKKTDKIERLRNLLIESNINFKEVDCLPEGFKRFTFHAPIKTKTFSGELLKANREQLAIIAEECLIWDGDGKAFYTSVKQNADFIQYAISSTGVRASLKEYVRKGKPGHYKPEFKVITSSKNSKVGFSTAKRSIIKGDGYKYCFQVPTGALLLRRNGNIFVTGNCGKTHVVKVASEFVDVPLIIEDSTKLTQEGYVGDSVDTILTRLIEAAEGKVEKAERGIIFLDEFDKLGGENDSKDGVSTVGVQQSLLRMVEGAKFNVSDRVGESRSAKKVEIDTSGITFIFAGAFGGLAKKVKGELKMSVKGGSVKSSRKITEHDIIKYGILPEILGRIGRYVVLHELTEEQMLHILTTTENCLVDQYKKLFELRGITWRMTEDDYKEIIESVKKSRLGARGLRHQIEIAVGEDMFNG